MKGARYDCRTVSSGGYFLRFRLMLALLLLAADCAGAPADERRIALVVGVSNYKHAPRLPNTHNDARGVSEALGRLGFEVEQLLDPDRVTLETGVRNLRQRARGADASLFYYAGHALELGGRNWLLPVGADLQTDRDLRFRGPRSRFRPRADGRRITGSALVFLDACRENPFRMKLAGGSREVSTRGLARVASGSCTFPSWLSRRRPARSRRMGRAPTARSPPRCSNGSKPRESELRRMLSQVRVDVREATDGRQVPWENSALEGDFFFRPPPSAATTVVVPAPPAPPPCAGADREVVFWNSISGSRDPADFRAYLAQFPQGIFAAARAQPARADAGRTGAPAGHAQFLPPRLPPPSTPPPPSAAAPPLLDTAALAIARSIAPHAARRRIAPEQSCSSARRYRAQLRAHCGARRALAVLPGTTLRPGELVSTPRGKHPEEKALEACQFQHQSPVRADRRGRQGAARTSGRALDTPRHAARPPRGALRSRTDTGAARGRPQSRPDVKGYATLADPKAVAYHPWGRVFIASATPNQRTAEEQALAACNGDPGRKRGWALLSLRGRQQGDPAAAAHDHAPSRRNGRASHLDHRVGPESVGELCGGHEPKGARD